MRAVDGASLERALARAFGMDLEDAAAVSDVIGEVFRDEAEVPDETLDAEVRSLFYTLEAKKLLAFRREDRVWETGERRRAFYWRVRDAEIRRLAEPVAGIAADFDPYAALPASAWQRRNAGA
ncbi:MAG: hypothetical protein ACYDCK_07760 [Thermoplasmatota archaeon]